MNHRPSAALRLRRSAAALVCAGLLLPPPLYAQGTGNRNATAARASTPVTLNFVNADIEAVTRAMGAILDKTFIVDPRVKGTITVYSEQPLSPAAAYQTYLAALRGLGFAVVDSGGLLKVLPEAEAKLQTGTVTVGGAGSRGDQVVTQIFRLNHENPNNLVAVLRPLISANNTINANPGNNSLVITDYAENLQRLGKIIAALDQPAGTDIDVVPLQHAVASDLAPLVQRLSDASGGSGAGGVPGVPAAVVPGGAGGGTMVMAEPRSNALIIRGANGAKLVQIRSIIERLDKPVQGGGPAGNIWVVYLKNADAVKLAAVLRAAFAVNSGGGGSGGGSSLGGGGSSPSTGISGLQNTSSNSSSSLGGSSGGSGLGSSAATAPLQASQGPSTGGFIQADPSTNSLIITAPEPLYRQVRTAIDQLDSRRAQIYVESMIVKVDATKLGQFGVQWQHLFGNSGDRTLFGLGTNSGITGGNILGLTAGLASGVTSTAATSALSSVPQGFNLGLVQKIGSRYTLGAIANFLENNVGANLLSTPNLIALDNEEAKIVIGQNVPFVTGTYANTTGSSTVNPFQTIDRQDVGLTLRIKSQIGEGGTIKMTIYQENSSVVGTSATAGPTTDKSSIETSVIVDDGQIMVLGGLLKDEYTDGEDRVPGLSGIPVLGNLFRNEKRQRVKTNLMVFLRPVVIRDQATANALTIDRYESIRAVQQQGQPRQSIVIPVNEAPVLPALPAQPAASVPRPLGEAASAPAGAASEPR